MFFFKVLWEIVWSTFKILNEKIFFSLEKGNYVKVEKVKPEKMSQKNLFLIAGQPKVICDSSNIRHSLSDYTIIVRGKKFI